MTRRLLNTNVITRFRRVIQLGRPDKPGDDEYFCKS